MIPVAAVADYILDKIDRDGICDHVDILDTDPTTVIPCNSKAEYADGKCFDHTIHRVRGRSSGA